jgi:hypothetical protein
VQPYSQTRVQRWVGGPNGARAVLGRAAMAACQPTDNLYKTDRDYLEIKLSIMNIENQNQNAENLVLKWWFPAHYGQL